MKIDPDDNAVDGASVTITVDASPARLNVGTWHPQLKTVPATDNPPTKNAASSVLATGVCP